MAHVIMGHGVSCCVGTSLAPIDILARYFSPKKLDTLAVAGGSLNPAHMVPLWGVKLGPWKQNS